MNSWLLSQPRITPGPLAFLVNCYLRSQVKKIKGLSKHPYEFTVASSYVYQFPACVQLCNIQEQLLLSATFMLQLNNMVSLSGSDVCHFPIQVFHDLAILLLPESITESIFCHRGVPGVRAWNKAPSLRGQLLSHTGHQTDIAEWEAHFLLCQREATKFIISLLVL